MNQMNVFLLLFRLWQEKRNLPEHQGESAISFYTWRIFSLVGYIVIVSMSFFLPVLIMIAVDRWFLLPIFAFEIISFLSICLTAFLAFFLINSFEVLVLRLELRNRK